MFFRAKVDEFGRVKLFNKTVFDAWVSQFKEKEIRIEIEEYDKHSHNQRKWFHWVCRYVAKHCEGYTEADVKLAMKGLFLPALFDEDGTAKIGQTRKLTKEEYSLLIDATIMWAAEKLELVVPDPRKPV